MTSSERQNLIIQYLDGELEPDLYKYVKQKVQTDKSWEAELKSYESLYNDFHELETIKAEPDFMSKLRARMIAEQGTPVESLSVWQLIMLLVHRTFTHKITIPVPVAATFVIIILTAFMINVNPLSNSGNKDQIVSNNENTETTATVPATSITSGEADRVIMDQNNAARIETVANTVPAKNDMSSQAPQVVNIFDNPGSYGLQPIILGDSIVFKTAIDNVPWVFIGKPTSDDVYFNMIGKHNNNKQALGYYNLTPSPAPNNNVYNASMENGNLH